MWFVSTANLRALLRLCCALLLHINSLSATSSRTQLEDDLKLLVTLNHNDHQDQLHAHRFDDNELFYGPVQLHCAEITSDTPQPGNDEMTPEISTVVNWTAPGWAHETTAAGLSVRSMSKVFVSTVVHELTHKGNGLSLGMKLSDLFPECAGSTHLLRDTTLKSFMSMESPLDHRVDMIFSAQHVNQHESQYGAPGTHPCELQNLSHQQCVRQLLCPLYSAEDVLQAYAENPQHFGPERRFVLADAEIVDTRCVDDAAEFASQCSDWALNGFCYKNPAFMLAKCPRTCKVCEIVSNSSCTDAAWCPRTLQK